MKIDYSVKFRIFILNTFVEWLDFDIAGFELGKHLGLIPADKDFIDVKYMFWAKDEIGESIISALEHLCDVGILVKNDDMQYKRKEAC